MSHVAFVKEFESNIRALKITMIFEGLFLGFEALGVGTTRSGRGHAPARKGFGLYGTLDSSGSRSSSDSSGSSSIKVAAPVAGFAGVSRPASSGLW